MTNETQVGVTVNVQNMQGKWLFLAPVGNLVLTTDVNNEFQLRKVTFITSEKFRRILKRLKLDRLHVRQGSPLNKLLESSQTIAMFRHTGKPADIQRECLQFVRNDIDLISASQLFYCKRKSMSRLGLIGEFKRGINQHAFLGLNNKYQHVTSALADHAFPLKLDNNWKNFHKKFFFLRFMKMLSGEITIEKKWKEDIVRSVMLVGKSVNSCDIGSAFLWNMVALEMLLTRQGDKYSDVLPKRLQALLGWIGYWDTENFQDRIEDVYLTRCKVVHDGRLELVKAEHLLFTEDLLMNVLVNLFHHPKFFRCKNDVIDFAELVSAEHLLGQKSRIRPKTLKFVTQTHSARDYDL